MNSEPLDIEDLVKLGQSSGPCPYLLSKEMAGSADIVFMPYNYLIDAKNRMGLGKIVWENSVLIFDEAHNLEVHPCSCSQLHAFMHVVFAFKCKLHWLIFFHAYPFVVNP